MKKVLLITYAFFVSLCSIAQINSKATAEPDIDNGGGSTDIEIQTKLVRTLNIYKDGVVTHEHEIEQIDSIKFVKKEVATGNYINGYEYVDLGLPSGTKWATHNVGATTYTELGGEYTWANKEWSSYTTINSIGDYSGFEVFDVARSSWGGTWRTPTWKDAFELQHYCTFENVDIDGVKCVKCTGPNGNYIIFKEYNQAATAYYWTSSPAYGANQKWIYFDFSIGHIRYIGIGTVTNSSRLGVIRPVSD